MSGYSSEAQELLRVPHKGPLQHPNVPRVLSQLLLHRLSLQFSQWKTLGSPLYLPPHWHFGFIFETLSSCQAESCPVCTDLFAELQELCPTPCNPQGIPCSPKTGGKDWAPIDLPRLTGTADVPSFLIFTNI